MKSIEKVVGFFSHTNEVNQRVLFGLVMLVFLGFPLLLGGKPFVCVLLLLAVLVTVEYVTIAKTPSKFIIGFIIAEFCLIYLMRESQNGLQKVLLIAFIIAVFDTIAYFVGKSFGKHKLCPTISPGKTIEGLIGGILGVTICSMPLYFVLDIKLNFSLYLIVVAVLAFLSQMGDIMESAFKRRNNVKDSSQLIPGHGGVLDRFDGYILVIPVFVVLNIILHLF